MHPGSISSIIFGSSHCQHQLVLLLLSSCCWVSVFVMLHRLILSPLSWRSRCGFSCRCILQMPHLCTIVYSPSHLCEVLTVFLVFLGGTLSPSLVSSNCPCLNLLLLCIRMKLLSVSRVVFILREIIVLPLDGEMSLCPLLISGFCLSLLMFQIGNLMLAPLMFLSYLLVAPQWDNKCIHTSWT